MRNTDSVIVAEDIEKQKLQAIFDSFNEAEFSEPDLDWSSEEDEPPEVRGRKGKGKGEGEEGKEGNETGD